MKKVKICINCRREMLIHAKQMCCTCYKRLYWTPKIIICPRCKRKIAHHSKGLCKGCYMTTYHLEAVKKFNMKKAHNIDYETYKRLTTKCIVCGFSKFVELHHLDRDHNNTNHNNLIGLCPNHHRMIHTEQFTQEILNQIKQKRSQPTTKNTITLTINSKNELPCRIGGQEGN